MAPKSAKSRADLGWRENRYVYLWLSPFAVHLKLQHCSSAIRQYKIKSLKSELKKKKKSRSTSQTVYSALAGSK